MTETLTIQPTTTDKLQYALNRVGEGKAYDALRLMPGVYPITKSLYVNSESEVFGNKNVTLRLVSNAPTSVFKVMTPIFGNKLGTEIHDVCFHGFNIDGNSAKQTVKHGQGYHNAFYFQNCKNIDIHGMKIFNSQGDGVRLKNCENIDIIGNTIDRIGHDAAYLIGCDNITYASNAVNLRTNSGFRSANSNRVRIFDNLITGGSEWWRGGPGIQLDHTDFTVVDELEAYNNTLYQTFGPAFWLSNYGEASKDLSLCKDYHIHDNRIIECGLNNSIDWVGGMIWSGVDNVLFEYNTLVDNYRYGIAGHVGSSVWTTRPKGKGYSFTARKNVIAGTQLGLFKNGVANGYGVALTMFQSHCMESEDNIIFDNKGGSHLNVKSETDSEEAIELDEDYFPIDAVDCGCRI